MPAMEERRRSEAPARSQRPHFEQFFALRRFQPTIAFSPDGTTIYYSWDASGQFNVWRVPVDGGCAQQVTAFERESVRQITATPDGRSLVLSADRDGDEFHQLYAVETDAGWPEAWTDAARVQHTVDQRGWSPDGRRLAFSANAETPTSQEVWVRDVASGAVEKVFGGDVFALPAGWSPDGRGLAVLDLRSNSDQSLHLVVDGESRELTPHEGEVKFLPGPWKHDGSGLFVLTDADREFSGLAFCPVDGSALRWLETPDADVEELAGSRDGRLLAWIVNERGWSRLVLRDLESGDLMPAPQLRPGTSPAFGSALAVSPDGRRVALLWAQPRRPTELYVVETATGEATRLTDSALGGLREEDLASPEEIRYRSFDGREIPAWLFRPDDEGPRPVVLAIHGGPESQERPLYQPLYQYLLSRGIAVLATNIRGSTGYGKTYQRLIHRDWGGGDLEDWRHAVEWLRGREWVDRDRIGVSGGSYGGFATLTCVTRLPDYWAAAVDIVGPSNLVTFVESVPPTWRRFMARWVGDAEQDAEFLRERSPITYVENVRAPLLVIQGANDPRVVKAESDQMVERLRGLGRQVEYLVYDDEGHGFTKRRNQIDAFRRTADWLERGLLGEEP
jgi:dipeptidyl aminopeptidase/acylaminoacyl peptidase